ncbi:hypothetical protein [Microbacterium lacticum]
MRKSIETRSMFAITRDDADADALLAEVLEGLRGIAAPLLTEREHRDGQQPRGELFRVGALVGQRVRAEPEHERAPSARRALDHGRAERVGLAPSTHVPGASSNDTALHLRADENAIVSAARRGGSSPKGAASVRAVALASGAVPYQPSVRCQPGA